MQYKPTFAIVVWIALTLLLGACTSTATPTTAPQPIEPTQAISTPAETRPPAPSENQPAVSQASPTAITVWYPLPTSGSSKETLDSLVARFNASQKDVKVTLELTGNDADNFEKIQAAITAARPPDAALVDLLQIPQFANAGALLPLDDLARDPAFKFEDLARAFMGNSFWNGSFYAVPWQRSTTMMYWNKAAFIKAGLDPNKPPVTWDEACEMARKLTLREGDQVTQWGMGGTISADWLFEGLLFSFGGALVTDDGKQAVYNSPEALAALNVWNDMSKKDKTLSVRPVSESAQVTPAFIAGKIAMILDSSFSRALIEKNARFEWGAGPIPGGPDGPVLNAGGGNFVIFAKTSPEKQKAAKTFIQWMTSPANTAEYSIKSGYLPVRISALQDPAMVDYLSKNPTARAVIDAAFKYGRSRTVAANMEKAVNQFFNPALRAVLEGNADPKATLDDAVKKSNEVLALQ